MIVATARHSTENNSEESTERAVIRLPPWLGDIDVLFEELRLKNFAIGIGEHTKAILLLDQLMKQGVSIQQHDELLRWLAPAICNTETQREQLAELLRLKQHNYELELKRALEKEAAPVVAADHSEKKTPLLQLGFLLVVAMVVVLALVDNWRADDGEDTKEDTPITAPLEAPITDQTGFNIADIFSFSMPEFNQGYLLRIILALCFSGWAVRGIYQHRHQTLKLARKVSEHQFTEKPIRYHLDIANLFAGAELRHPLQILRQHINVSSHQIDVDRTLGATIKAGGKITLQEGTRPQLPEYLLLTRKTSAEDHHSILAQSLQQRLQQEQILVNRVDYNVDPRRCRDCYGQVVNLEDMQGGQIHQRLMMVADADEFFFKGSEHPQPWLDLVQRWHWVSVLTTKPSAEWGKKEMLLVEQGVRLQPISPAGIDTLAKQLQEESEPESIRPGESQTILWSYLENDAHRWTHSHRPGQEDIEELYRQLCKGLPNSTFELLRALAVLPVLTPNLTLYLAQTLQHIDKQRFTERTLEEDFAYLARLPWFRVGYMPEWLRLRLIHKLPASLAESIKQIGQSIIANDLSEVDANLVIKIADENKAEWQHLLKGIYKYGDKSELHDYIFLGFLAGDSRLDLEVAPGSRLSKAVMPKISATEMRYGLIGILPALLLLPRNEFLENIIGSPVYDFFSWLDQYVVFLNQAYAYSVLVLLFCWLMSKVTQHRLLNYTINFSALMQFVIAGIAWLGGNFYGYGIAGNEKLLIATGLMLVYWLSPENDNKLQQDMKLYFDAKHWSRFWLVPIIAIALLFNFIDDFQGRTVTSLMDALMLPLMLSLGLVAVVLTILHYGFYVYRISKHQNALVRPVLGFLTVFYFCFIAGWSSAGFVVVDAELVTLLPAALSISVVIAAKYLSRYFSSPIIVEYVNWLYKLLLPWLLITYTMKWLLGWQDSPLGIGVFLWLAVCFNVREYYLYSVTEMRPYLLWGGTLIILNTLLKLALPDIDTWGWMVYSDFLSLALFVPTARVCVPELFVDKALQDNFLQLLPFYCLVPLVAIAINVFVESYSFGFAFSLCLLPYAVWLAKTYGAKSHWVFVSGYLASLLISFLSLVIESDYNTDAASEVIAQLIPANFIIYVVGKYSNWSWFVGVTKSDISQWLFSIVVVACTLAVFVNNSDFAWNGFIIGMVLLLLFSVSNANLWQPFVVMSAVFVSAFIAYVLTIEPLSEANISLWLSPVTFEEYIVFIVCLLGFRVLYRANYKVGLQGIEPRPSRSMLGIYIVLAAIIPLDVFNISLNLTEFIAIDLVSPYLIAVLCLLVGALLKTVNYKSFLIPLTAWHLVLLIIPILMDKTIGGDVWQWRVDYLGTVTLCVAYGLFYQLGRACQTLVDEKHYYLQEFARQAAYRRPETKMGVEQSTQQPIPTGGFDETVMMSEPNAEPEPAFSPEVIAARGVDIHLMQPTLVDVTGERDEFPMFKKSALTTGLLTVFVITWVAQTVYFVADGFKGGNPLPDQSQMIDNDVIEKGEDDSRRENTMKEEIKQRAPSIEQENYERPINDDERREKIEKARPMPPTNIRIN